MGADTLHHASTLLPCFETSKGVIVAGRFSLSDADSKSSADVLRSWHGFYSELEALLPQGNVISVCSSSSQFMYIFGEDAVAEATTFAQAVVELTRKGLNKQVHVGVAMGDISSGFVGQRFVTFEAFGRPVQQALLAASSGRPGQLWVADNVAAQLLPMFKLEAEVVVDGCTLYTAVPSEQGSASTSDAFARQLLRSSKRWLFYHNPNVEMRFLLIENLHVVHAERIFLLIGILCIMLFHRKFVLLGDMDEILNMPMAIASFTWLMTALTALGLSTFLPDLYIRYREYAMVLQRLLSCLTVCWDSHLLSGLMVPLLGYASASMVMNAIGFKVRFHIQVMLSTITCLVGIAFMAYNEVTGRQHVPLYQALLILASWLLPNVLVYKMDVGARRKFESKMHK